MVDACTQLSAAVQSRADALCVCVCVRVCVCVCRNMLPGIDNLRPCTQIQRSKRLPFPPMPLVMERDFVCLCLCLCDRVSVCLCVLDGSLPALYPLTQLSQEQMCVCVCVCVRVCVATLCLVPALLLQLSVHHTPRRPPCTLSPCKCLCPSPLTANQAIPSTRLV